MHYPLFLLLFIGNMLVLSRKFLPFSMVKKASRFIILALSYAIYSIFPVFFNVMKIASYTVIVGLASIAIFFSKILGSVAPVFTRLRSRIKSAFYQKHTLSRLRVFTQKRAYITPHTGVMMVFAVSIIYLMHKTTLFTKGVFFLGRLAAKKIALKIRHASVKMKRKAPLLLTS